MSILGSAYKDVCPCNLQVHPHGSTDSLPFCTMGSGSLAAMAVFEAGFKEELSREDAIALVARAIRSGVTSIRSKALSCVKAEKNGLTPSCAGHCFSLAGCKSNKEPLERWCSHGNPVDAVKANRLTRQPTFVHDHNAIRNSCFVNGFTNSFMLQVSTMTWDLAQM